MEFTDDFSNDPSDPIEETVYSKEYDKQGDEENNDYDYAIVEDNWFYNHDFIKQETIENLIASIKNNSKNIYEFYRRNNYLFVSHDFIWNNEIKKKEMKKICGNYSEFENIDDCIEHFHDDRNSISIITGEKSNLTCLDIDDESKCQDLVKQCKAECNWHENSVSSLNKHHFFFQYEKDLPNFNDVNKIVDIKNKTVVSVFPSHYMKGTEYKSTNLIKIGLPNIMSEKLKKILLKYLPKKKKNKRPNVIIEEYNPNSGELSELLKIIIFPNISGYHDKRIAIGMSLKNMKKDFEIYKDWFLKQPNCDKTEEELLKEWNSFDYNGILNIGKIKQIARDMYPLKYRIWVENINKIENYYWNNFIEDSKINFKTIEEMVNKILRKLQNVFIYIQDGTGKIIIKESESEFSIMKYNPKNFILKFDYIDEKNENGDMSFDLFLHSYIKYLPLYTSIVCKPKIEDTKYHEFNIWKDFKAKEVKEVDMNKINLKLNHIKEIWANNDLDNFNYIITWLAYLIQKPWEKTEIALVLYSKPGVGKTILTSFLIKYILGSDKAVEIEDINNILGRFNSVLKNKLFVCIKELATLREEFHKTFDKFKSLITDSTISIEQKGLDIITLENISNFIICTNNDFSVKIEDSDRRYSVFKCSDKYKGNFEYFNKLAEENTEESANHFYTYLKRYKIEINLKNIPQTEIRKDMIDMSLPSSLRFLKYCKENPNSLIQSLSLLNDFINASEFYNNYKKWCENNGEQLCSNKAFGRQIKDNIDKERRTSSYVYLLKSIKIDM